MYNWFKISWHCLFKANTMAVNVSRTKYIIFKTKGKKRKTLARRRGCFMLIMRLDNWLTRHNPNPQKRTGTTVYIIQYLSLDYTMHCTHIFVQYSNTIAHLKYVTREENLISNTSLKTLYTLQCLTRNFLNVSLNVLLNLKKYKCAQSEPTPIPNHLHTQLFIFYSIL